MARIPSLLDYLPTIEEFSKAPDRHPGQGQSSWERRNTARNTEGRYGNIPPSAAPCFSASAVMPTSSSSTKVKESAAIATVIGGRLS